MTDHKSLPLAYREVWEPPARRISKRIGHRLCDMAIWTAILGAAILFGVAMGGR